MAFLDFIKNRNAAPQPPVAPAQQPQIQTTPSVESLSEKVKAQAVEAARPAAQLMDKASKPSSAPVQPQATPNANAVARGRSLSVER
jgi:hypothetical protein